jgi:hypothetical protein
MHPAAAAAVMTCETIHPCLPDHIGVLIDDIYQLIYVNNKKSTGRGFGFGFGKTPSRWLDYQTKHLKLTTEGWTDRALKQRT